jgi:hypothetical protein
MPTAAEIRERMASVDARTQAQLSPNPARAEMVDRIARNNRDLARQFSTPPQAPVGTQFTQPGVSTNNTFIEPGNPGFTGPQPAPAPTARPSAFQRARALFGRGATVAAEAAPRVAAVAESVAPAAAGFLSRRISTPYKVALATAGALGAGVAGADEETQRQTFYDAGADFAGDRVGDYVGPNAPRLNSTVMDVGSVVNQATFGAPAALSRVANAVANPKLNPLTGEPEQGLDRVLGGVQALVNPRENRIERAAAYRTPGGYATMGSDTNIDAVNPPPAVTTTAASPEQLGEIAPGGNYRPNTAGPALLNSIRGKDGVNRPVDPNAVVNTIAAPDKAAFDESVARNDAFNGRIAAERVAVGNKIATAQQGARNQTMRQLIGRLGKGDAKMQRTTREKLAGLQQMTNNAGFNIGGVRGTNNNVDPLSTPAVIAARLREGGSEVRSQREAQQKQNAADAAERTANGFKPDLGIDGKPQSYTGRTKNGVVVTLAPTELQTMGATFNQLRASGDIPENADFMEYAALLQSRAQKDTGKG